MSREEIRLLILQILANQPASTAHQEFLLEMLKLRNCPLSRDTLHMELSWLERIADTVILNICRGVYIATLTDVGHEVVEGVTVLPDISRPLSRSKPHATR